MYIIENLKDLSDKGGSMEDFDILIPEIEAIDIKDRKTKKVFKLDLFVPNAVGLLITENIGLLQKIFKGEFDKEGIDFINKIFEAIFMRQHKFMTKQWCLDNIDLAKSIVILSQIVRPILDYLKATGMTLPGLVVMPKKKPEDTNDAATTI